MGKSITTSPLSCVDFSLKEVAKAKQDLDKWLEGSPRPQELVPAPRFDKAKRCLNNRGVELTFIQSKGVVHEITERWQLDFSRRALLFTRICAAPDQGKPVRGCDSPEDQPKNHEVRPLIPERDQPYGVKTFFEETDVGKGLLFFVGLIRDALSPSESLASQPVLARNHQEGNSDGSY